jgi:hypothetical protein
MLQYMDKVSLGYSTQLGLTKDLVSCPHIIFLVQELTHLETGRQRIFMGWFDLLLWLSRMELALFVSLGPNSSWKVPRRNCRHLGYSSHVPWSRSKCNWIIGRSILLGCSRSRRCTWVFSYCRHVLQAYGATFSVRRYFCPHCS